MKGEQADYLKYLDGGEWSSAIITLAEEILELRRMAWMNHGHGTVGLYGDDGEMQCHECLNEYGFFDWRRIDLSEIKERMFDRKIRDFGHRVETAKTADAVGIADDRPDSFVRGKVEEIRAAVDLSEVVDFSDVKETLERMEKEILERNEKGDRENEPAGKHRWEMTITAVDNGFIFRSFEGDVEVVEVEEDKGGEKDTMTKVLEHVAAFFGLGYDKFERENLKIKWNRKGHKAV